MTFIDPAQLDLEDRVVAINRITKVVKGGRRLRFAALVIVGDHNGHVGFGTGKAQEVPEGFPDGSVCASLYLRHDPVRYAADLPLALRRTDQPHHAGLAGRSR